MSASALLGLCEKAVREAAAQLAAVLDGPSVRAEVDKSREAKPPKKPKLMSITGKERSARIPAGIPSLTGGVLPSDATSDRFLGDSNTESAPVSRAGLSKTDSIQIIEDRGDSNEKLLASMPGPTSSCDQERRSASPFHQLRRSPTASRIGLRSVPPPLVSVKRVSLPSSVDPRGTGVVPLVALPGVVIGAPTPGSVSLPPVLEVKLPSTAGKIDPVPEDFVDTEILAELGRSIMDVPILDASNLTLQWPCLRVAAYP